MPGYNHYIDCTCGWCLKPSGNGRAIRPNTYYLDRSIAEKTLSRTGANKSWSACFVDPNAACPVCGDRVYYYENRFGSRVFFDELGWPWPKHRCTDRRTCTPDRPAPVLRKQGEVTEIFEAAQRIGPDPSVAFRSRYGRLPWELLRVETVATRGFEHFIRAVSISPYSNKPRFFAFSSSKLHPEEGDFFGFEESEVSFLDADLERRHLKARPISEIDFTSVKDEKGLGGPSLGAKEMTEENMLRDKFDHGFAESDWEAAKEEARQVMIECARARRMIPYSDLVAKITRIRLQAHDARLSHFLGEIASEEDAMGRGLLTVLVVHKSGDMQPGPGFFELAQSRGRDTSNIVECWVEELKAVFSYWRDK